MVAPNENPDKLVRASDSAAQQSPPSVFADLVNPRPVVRAVTMTDLAGLVVGFACASYIYRGTILAIFDAGTVGLTAVASIVFVWLGTSIAGPIVLGVRRMQHGRRTKLSAGESIWGVVGSMWLAVGLARSLRPVDPAMMSNVASVAATAAAALAPLFVILFWWLQRARPRPGIPDTWCHHVGIVCAVAWPAGWTLAAFLLGV